MATRKLPSKPVETVLCDPDDDVPCPYCKGGEHPDYEDCLAYDGSGVVPYGAIGARDDEYLHDETLNYEPSRPNIGGETRA